eukprot:CAMPEP_0194204980 /NCGR_PEP_ID=MMETSP0156-20130528/4353_1 /TAXON_ID=33649 /ORGANISM="Thalassionema nitzschioides, Strain L26-B" /LENGTH=496 /DNA_ID=CAMNT_0038931127 /DNA_START=197 /DNA_END=1687 /DNA_ORIENTATION=-
MTSTDSNENSLSQRFLGWDGNKNIPECAKGTKFCTIEKLNKDIVHGLLQKVVETDYFSHFKIDLCSECTLWEDFPLCKMKDCSVCECNEPPSWSYVNVEDFPSTGPDLKNGCDSTTIADDNVVTTVDPFVIDGWTNNNMFLFGKESQDTQRSEKEEAASNRNASAQVVDLRLNPEGYTGYTGPSAEKVWSEIHSTNCYQPQPPMSDEPSSTPAEEKKNDSSPPVAYSDDKNNNRRDNYCLLSSEQRLYNRFISGLHSSISLHIAHSFCLEMDPEKVGECKMWGLNDEIASDRVLQYPDRVENLYVAFTLLLKAVIKAEYAIEAAIPHDDPSLLESLMHWKESLLPELISLPDKLPDNTLLFDESVLQKDPDFHPQKRMELQHRFEHLTKIMQCVGCDRCKLWGTLQTLGLGTALRVLFYDQQEDGGLNLSRQEAVALVNTLERLSSSLVYAREFQQRREEKEFWKNKSGGDNYDNSSQDDKGEENHHAALVCSSTF